MKKLFFVLLLACLTVFSLESKDKITGLVLDGNTNEKLPFTTVALRNSSLELISGATGEDDGSFIISAKTGSYILEISLIGYKSLQLNVTVPEEDDLHLGEIRLETDTDMINAAVIQTRRPAIEQRLDRLVMNVSQTLSAQGSSSDEILNKAPGVYVDKDGKVTLNGQGAAVWIDGRPSNISGQALLSLLMSMDGSTIDKIEIMAHPAASHDAEGSGGIVNICLKKAVLQGLNGSVSLTYGGMQFNRYIQQANGSLSLGYRAPKSSTSLTYSPRYKESGSYLDADTDLNQGGVTLHSGTDWFNAQTIHYARLAHDWFANDKNTFGAILSFNTYNDKDQAGKDIGDSFTDTFLDGVKQYRQYSELLDKEGNGNFIGNLNYTHIFNAKKSTELTINADYAHYEFNDFSSQNNIYTNSAADLTLPENIIFKTNSERAINIMSGKADFKTTLLKRGQFEAGIKAARSITNNNTIRQDFKSGIWSENTNEASLFDYSEDIFAGYISAAYQFNKKWSSKIGLRGEYTSSLGKWYSASSESRSNYLNFFPTFFVGYTPSESLRLSLSYARRITRPSFSEYNPHKIYVDATTYKVGNPELMPEFSDNVSFSVGLGRHINVSAMMRHISDLIVQTAYFSEKEKWIIYENYGSQLLAGGNFSLTELSISKWLILNANLLVGNLSGKSTSDNYSSSQLFVQGNGSLTVLLPKNWKFEMTANYRSNAQVGQIVSLARFMADCGVKKSLWDGKGTMTIWLGDMFRTASSGLKMYSNNKLAYDMRQPVYTQRLSLSFSYRFGNVKQTKKRNVGTFEETERAESSAD